MIVKRLSQHLISILVACTLAACTAPTTEPPPENINALGQEVDALVSEAMAALEYVPGFAVAIYTEQGSYARGYGIADMETGEPITADTAFYIASTTKAFTGLAMNLLHHRGELDLDTSITDYAPTAPFPVEVRTQGRAPAQPAHPHSRDFQ